MCMESEFCYGVGEDMNNLLAEYGFDGGSR